MAASRSNRVVRKQAVAMLYRIGMTGKEISQRLGYSPTTTANIINGLGGRKAVGKRPSPAEVFSAVVKIFMEIFIWKFAPTMELRPPVKEPVWSEIFPKNPSEELLNLLFSVSREVLQLDTTITHLRGSYQTLLILIKPLFTLKRYNAEFINILWYSGKDENHIIEGVLGGHKILKDWDPTEFFYRVFKDETDSQICYSAVNPTDLSAKLMEIFVQQVLAPSLHNSFAKTWEKIMPPLYVKETGEAFPEQEQTVINLLCGIGEGNTAPKTLYEVGNLLNLSAERIRQIKEKAVRRTRQVYMHKKIRLPLRLPENIYFPNFL